jgi:hypothetical protein
MEKLMKRCSVPECDRKHYGQGFCGKHYKTAYKSGAIKNPRLERKVPLAVRLEKYSHIDPLSGCIEWFDAKDGCGYGKLFVNKKTVSAHRIAYELVNGPIPEGLIVLHKCDNTSCVNAAHLFLGTHKDNAIDRNAKGRNAFQGGECGSAAKLTEEKVRRIRFDTRSQEVIAYDYGVHQATISKIKLRKSWTHVA